MVTPYKPTQRYSTEDRCQDHIQNISNAGITRSFLTVPEGNDELSVEDRLSRSIETT